MKTQPTPAANFDLVARPYCWMEYLAFGRALERCRNHFLPLLSGHRRALVIGDGDGRFLARLLAANPELQADAVDSSAAMLRSLQHRTRASATRLSIHQAEALAYTPANPCDLIVTHFFLDCLTQSQVDALALHLAQHACPHALWLISDFHIPTGPMRFPARVLIRSLYLAFRLLTGLRTTALPNHSAALSAAGFRCVAQLLSLAGMLTSELWEYTPAMLPPHKPKTSYPLDPVPDPEPASPSLPGPDPDVFNPQQDKETGTPRLQ